MPEKWKDIPGYDGYQVSSSGKVRSRVNNRHGLGTKYHELRQVLSKKGYQTVVLRRGNRRLVHRLVASAFIPNPKNLPIVRHMDDNPLNNHFKNLKWGTQTDNMQDCVRHGRLVGDTTAAIESTKKPVIAISEKDGTRTKFASQSEAARHLGVWPQHISNVLKGRIRQTGGYRFEYPETEEKSEHH